MTLRWKGIDSKFQFRGALPSPTVRRLHSGVNGGSESPQQLYRFAEADDSASLVPMLRARAAEAEQLRRLPGANIAELVRRIVI
jgi:hypothetical protein